MTTPPDSYHNSSDSIARKNNESIKESILHHDKMQPSSTIIFSMSNAMIGPTILLLPLNIVNIGLLTSVVVAIVICLISWRTCQLTHLHSKLDEVEYIPAIKRTMGKGWMYLYFAHSLVTLWMAAIIYFLSLSDVTYSCLKLMFNAKDWPSEDTFTLERFSYQYTGIILMSLIGGLFFLKKLGRILDLTEKGIYSILVEGAFALYLGAKAVASGTVKLVFYSENLEYPREELGLMSSESLIYTIGVFAMAFCVHNAVVAIVRKNKVQTENYNCVSKAYTITFVTYVITGSLGAIGLYQKITPGANTILNNSLYDRDDTLTFILLVITQLMTAFQLVTVLPVINNVVKTQFFIIIYGENGVPPKAAYIAFNVVFIVSLLTVQLLNISPNAVMSYSGAFIGFVIIYLLPIGIHVKTLKLRQQHETQNYLALTEGTKPSELQLEKIADFIQDKQKISYSMEYFVHGGIMAVGVSIFIIQFISLFQGE